MHQGGGMEGRNAATCSHCKDSWGLFINPQLHPPGSGGLWLQAYAGQVRLVLLVGHTQPMPQRGSRALKGAVAAMRAAVLHQRRPLPPVGLVREEAGRQVEGRCSQPTSACT